MAADTSLADDFVRLGLAEYIEKYGPPRPALFSALLTRDRFIDEGFEDWTSIADITESDL